MTVKSLRCDNDVIAQWIMLENVFVLREYMLKYLGMECHDAESHFQIVQ